MEKLSLHHVLCFFPAKPYMCLLLLWLCRLGVTRRWFHVWLLLRERSKTTAILEEFKYFILKEIGK
jgi:hypothetical protein